MLKAPEPKLETAKRDARRLLWKAGGFSFFVNMLMLTGPLYMLQIYDRVLGSRSNETLVVITLLILGLFAAMALLDFARGALLARAGSAFENQLKELTFDLSMDVSREGASGTEQPLKDLRQIRQFVASPALTAVFDAPWTPIFLSIIFMMHWLLGLVAIFGFLVLLCLAIVNERVSRKANETAHGMTSAADRVAIAAMRNAAAVDAMGMREKLRTRWMQMSGQADVSSALATDRIGGFTAATKAFRFFLQSAILGTGAFLAIQGAVTPGVMIAASIITGRALAPLEIVTGQWRNFAMTLSAYKRFNQFIGPAMPAPARTPLPAPIGALRVDKVFCQPTGAKTPIIKGISFELAPGESLGIIGPSAAGKSTLARALVGVELVRAGEIRLDGADLRHWDRSALGNHIGFLPQEVELFAGTAAQNIARLEEEVDGEAVIAAAEAADAHEMILSFPEGYDTEIGERGRHLSAGQRQRLGLARALYKDPSLVVLDEPNANLDAEGDAALNTALRRLKERAATVVIVAHRPAAIETVDKLMLLADGEVRGFGPREEILQKIMPNRAIAGSPPPRPDPGPTPGPNPEPNSEPNPGPMPTPTPAPTQA
ncbi:MAG: type I secretion system permease/ATPase [Pseudomonadota bacterium]